jgi:RNA polymerase sigma factor (sigma-70 family)
VAVDVITALPGGDPSRFLRNEPDEALVAHVLQGSEAAFEVIYDRHHRGLIAFCRHMLRSREEAEDALQHTFAAAYRSLTAGERPNALKAWLYTIARNRCLTVLRARRTREDAAAAEAPADGAVVEGLSDAVQRRADLRELVADMHRLPEDQRAALVLFELGDHSHAEIADVLSVNREKVKALVFQAREGLLRARTARDTPCAEIRHHLSSRARALPRRGVIRGHLDCCPACAAYDLEVRRQRAALALVMPVVPSLELKGSVLGPLLGSGATVAAGGAAAIGTGAAGTAVTAGAGAAGAGGGVAGAGAAGGALALASGAGSGLTGGAAVTGLGALAANAVVAKVVTVVAVAGASLGAGHAISTNMHDRSTPPTALSAPAAVAAATTIAAPVAPVAQPPDQTAPPPAHTAPAATTASTGPDATGSAATTASPAAGTATPDPAAQPSGGTPPPDSAAPAPSSAPAAPADGGASGSAPAGTTTPPAAPEPIVAQTADPDPSPVAGTAVDPTSSSAPPVNCPAGTEAVDPTVTPAPPPPTDPATPPPVPTVTLPDGSTVPIPDGCALVPPAAQTTATDAAASAVAMAAAAASDAPTTP